MIFGRVRIKLCLISYNIHSYWKVRVLRPVVGCYKQDIILIVLEQNLVVLVALYYLSIILILTRFSTWLIRLKSIWFSKKWFKIWGWLIWPETILNLIVVCRCVILFSLIRYPVFRRINLYLILTNLIPRTNQFSPVPIHYYRNSSINAPSIIHERLTIVRSNSATPSSAICYLISGLFHM